MRAVGSWCRSTTARCSAPRGRIHGDPIELIFDRHDGDYGNPDASIRATLMLSLQQTKHFDKQPVQGLSEVSLLFHRKRIVFEHLLMQVFVGQVF